MGVGRKRLVRKSPPLPTRAAASRCHGPSGHVAGYKYKATNKQVEVPVAFCKFAASQPRREPIAATLLPFDLAGHWCRFQLGKARDSILLPPSVVLSQALLSAVFSSVFFFPECNIFIFLALTNFILYGPSLSGKNGQLLHFRYSQGRGGT